MIWLAFSLGLVLTALGATAGAALLSVSRAELSEAVSRQLRGGGDTLEWLGRTEAYLTAASATTTFGVVLLGAAFPAVFAGSGRAVLAVVLPLVAVPFVLFSGYLAPRWLTRARAEAVVAAAVPLLERWSRVLGMILPARRPSRLQDVRTIWREATAVGLRTDEDLRLVGGAMSFVHRPIRQVMTPRTELVAIPEDAELGDIALVFAQSGYSRVPVYRGTLDEIVGMLHAFDLFKLHPGDPLPIRPVAMTPASRSAGDLLLDMRRERRHFAVVLDEFGGTLGIVTLEDLLEELVGEIFDEHDAGVLPTEPPSEPLVWETDGTEPVAAVEDRFGISLGVGAASTVGGLLAELAGRIPATGERFLLAGLEVDVVHASATRVERLILRPAAAPPIVLGGERP